MASKNKRFADDGWAVWVNGDDNSTVYINDWLNPQGESYVDFAVRIRGVKASKRLMYMFLSVLLKRKYRIHLCALRMKKYYVLPLVPPALLTIKRTSAPPRLPTMHAPLTLYIFLVSITN